MQSYWWADTSSTSTTWNWTGTSYFNDWIINNRSNNGYGIQGASFKTPSGVQIGDYIYVPGHVMFVTKAADSNSNGITDYNEIYISAHTNNHINKNLAALYGSVPPINMEFMEIYGVKYNTDMYSSWHLIH